MYHGITYDIAITVAEMNQMLEDNTGELWGVYCEDVGENWPRYNDTVLYLLLIWTS